MRLPLLLALVLAAAGMASAANHQVANDNGTTFPDAEESTEAGPRDNDPISWLQPGIIVVFLAAAAGVLLYMRKMSREDRRGRR